jgi:hypothetical protein
MSRIRSREEKQATTGNAPSSFSTGETPNCARCLTREQAAAPTTYRQPDAPYNPKDPHVRKTGLARWTIDGTLGAGIMGSQELTP